MSTKLWVLIKVLIAILYEQMLKSFPFSFFDFLQQHLNYNLFYIKKYKEQLMKNCGADKIWPKIYKLMNDTEL